MLARDDLHQLNWLMAAQKRNQRSSFLSRMELDRIFHRSKVGRSATLASHNCIHVPQLKVKEDMRCGIGCYFLSDKLNDLLRQAIHCVTMQHKENRSTNASLTVFDCVYFLRYPLKQESKSVRRGKHCSHMLSAVPKWSTSPFWDVQTAPSVSTNVFEHITFPISKGI